MVEDAELVRRYAEEHSEAAFAELVRRHLDLVYAAALRRLGGDAHAAADVAQQVFTALARQAGSLAQHAVLPAWLYATTRNVAVDFVRAEQRRRMREQGVSTMQTLFTATPDADWEKLRPVLDNVMDELSDADRTAVLLRFFQQRPFAEVGAVLSVTEDAARMRVDRALEKLRTLLARRGITSTTAALTTLLAGPALMAAPAGLAASVTGVALAGANGSGAAVGTAIFMSKSTIIASVAAIAVLVFALRESNQRRLAETAKTAADTELANLRGQLRTTAQRASAAEQQGTVLRSEVEALRAAPRTPAPVKITVASAQGDPAGDRGTQGTTLEEAMRENYGPFFRQLSLTPEQREQFVAIMVEWKQRGNELFGAGIAAGMKPGAQLSEQVLAQTNPDRAEKIRAQLGDATLQAFEQFETLRPLRNTTENLAAILFRADVPLSPTQADQLVAIMSGNVRIAGGKIDLATLDSDAIMTEAQGVLSSAQLPALRQSLNQILFMQRQRREAASPKN